MLATQHLLPISLLAVLLSACGGSSDTPSRPDSSHNHDQLDTQGRLAITTKDSNSVNIIDVKDKNLVATIAAENPAEYLYATENNRYALLVQRSVGKIEFIDGGIWQENHGDHMHPYEQNPELMAYHINGVKPAHVTAGEAHAAVFFDGDKDTGVNASVAVFNEQTIAQNPTTTPLLEYQTYMHGAAQTRDNYLVSTTRDVNSPTVLADSIALYQLTDSGAVEQIKVFDVTCPLLHGSAQNHDYIAFACSDGVVLIEQDEENFTARKLLNSDDFAENQRIGTLKAHHNNEQIIGIAGTDLFSINPATNTIEKLDWQITAEQRLSSGTFNHDGSHMLTLDRAGVLTVFKQESDSGHQHWQVKHNIQVTNDDLSAMPDGQMFKLTLSKQDDIVFIANPISKQIVSYDIETGDKVDTIELDFMPNNLIWLGIAEEEHSH